MAKVEYTPPINKLTGSLGGSVFQDTRSGSIIRSKGHHTKSLSSKQLTSVKASASRINEWRQLTIPQMQLWDSYALAHPKNTKFGKTTSLTGYQFFFSTNTILELLKVPLVTVPPVYVMPAALPVITPLNLAATIQITFASPLSRPGEWLMCYLGHPISPQNTVKRNALRLIEIIDATSVTTIDVTASWNAYFGLNYATIAATGSFVIPILITIADETSGIFPAGVSALYDRV